MQEKQIVNNHPSGKSTNTILETSNKYRRTPTLLILFMFMIISLSIISSCKKGKPSFHLRQEIKDYCLFKEGSQWNYRDDSTNNDLPVYIKQVYTSNVDDPRFTEERTYIEFQSSFIREYFLCHQCPDDNNWDNYNGDRLELSLKSDTNYSGGIAMWTYQTLNSDQIDPCGPFDHPKYVKSEFIDTVSIKSKVFINVIHTKIHSSDTSNSNPYSYSADFYFAKHIGLVHLRESYKYKSIRRSISLVSWNVNQ